MIVLLAVVIALMWLLPDGSQPAAPATNAPKTEQTKNTNDAPDDIEATTLVKAGTQHPISGWKCSTARPSPWAVCAAKWCF